MLSSLPGTPGLFCQVEEKSLFRLRLVSAAAFTSWTVSLRSETIAADLTIVWDLDAVPNWGTAILMLSLLLLAKYVNFKLKAVTVTKKHFWFYIRFCNFLKSFVSFSLEFFICTWPWEHVVQCVLKIGTNEEEETSRLNNSRISNFHVFIQQKTLNRTWNVPLLDGFLANNSFLIVLLMLKCLLSESNCVFFYIFHALVPNLGHQEHGKHKGLVVSTDASGPELEFSVGPKSRICLQDQASITKDISDLIGICLVKYESNKMSKQY